MARLSGKLEVTLTQQLETEVHTLTPLHGGCVGEVYKVDVTPCKIIPDKTLVVKVANTTTGTLDVEGYMLQYLKEKSALPVPTVFINQADLLVMSFIEGNSRFNAKAQESAAEHLAALHKIEGRTYGLERDTLIGGLHQPNVKTKTWQEFFVEHRLLHMARHAHEEKKLALQLLDRIEAFCGDIERWIPEPEFPSLLHGDCWTTNMLAEGDTMTGFLDPAIYYGHPEIELAFTTLFGTFHEPFFKRYHEINPIADGFFEVRKDLYNLYPLLVHVRLFGQSYASDVDRILRNIGY